MYSSKTPYPKRPPVGRIRSMPAHACFFECQIPLTEVESSLEALTSMACSETTFCHQTNPHQKIAGRWQDTHQHTHTHTHTHTNTHIHAHMQTCTPTHTHTHKHTHKHMHTCTHAHTHTYTSKHTHTHSSCEQAVCGCKQGDQASSALHPSRHPARGRCGKKPFPLAAPSRRKAAQQLLPSPK